MNNFLIELGNESPNSNTLLKLGLEAKISMSPNLIRDDFSNEVPMDLVNKSTV